jgi:hypothetical protein
LFRPILDTGCGLLPGKCYPAFETSRQARQLPLPERILSSAESENPRPRECCPRFGNIRPRRVNTNAHDRRSAASKRTSVPGPYVCILNAFSVFYCIAVGVLKQDEPVRKAAMKSPHRRRRTVLPPGRDPGIPLRPAIAYGALTNRDLLRPGLGCRGVVEGVNNLRLEPISFLRSDADLVYEDRSATAAPRRRLREPRPLTSTQCQSAPPGKPSMNLEIRNSIVERKCPASRATRALRANCK